MKKDINKNSEEFINNKKMFNDFDGFVEGEETTRYGEFVSSYFAWTGLARNKIRADELNEITKKQ